MEEESFFHQVFKSCQALLVCVRDLGVTAQSGDEDEIVQAIQRTAASVVSLNGLLEEQAERQDSDNSSFLPQLQALVDETRVQVVGYIRQSKKVFSNPLDYMTLQEFDNSKRMVCSFLCTRVTVYSQSLGLRISKEDCGLVAKYGRVVCI